IRALPQRERRTILESLQLNADIPYIFKISPLIEYDNWDTLKALHLKAREHAAEGFMIKRKDASYQSGRKKGDWWKWKTEPLTVDAVLIYAQKGSGRRAELFTDY